MSGSHSPPTLVVDMDHQFSCFDLLDEDVQFESTETTANFPVSVTCRISLGAGDTMCVRCRVVLSREESPSGIPSTGKETGSELALLMFMASEDNEGQEANQERSVESSSRASALALPTLMASENNEGQEASEERHIKSSSQASSPDLYNLLDMSWPWGSTPQCYPMPACSTNVDSEESESLVSFGEPFSPSDTSEDGLPYMEVATSDCRAAPWDDSAESESEETVRANMFGQSSQDVCGFLEDGIYKQIPGPKDDAEVNNTTHIPHENEEGITLQEAPDRFNMGEPQEVPRSSNKNRRRSWRRAKKQISRLFRRVFCCFCTPKKGDMSPRAEERALDHGS